MRRYLTLMALCGYACGASLSVPPSLGQLTVNANSLIGNITNATAAATNVSIPTCADTGGNHLNYSTGTGFTCGTSAGGGAATQGSYTPTATNIQNTSGITASVAYYTRVGNVVSVFGKLDFTMTGTPSPSRVCVIGLSLPVASAFTVAADAAGTSNCGSQCASALSGTDKAYDTAAFIASVANANVQMQLTTRADTNQSGTQYYHYSYIVK